jgi:hypothetical protein
MTNEQKAERPIEERLAAIEQRNRRVEADKAWEVSWLRRLLIAAVTYVFAGVMLSLINAERPWLGAFVPACGFLLSTFSLPVIKEQWMKRKMLKQQGQN